MHVRICIRKLYAQKLVYELLWIARQEYEHWKCYQWAFPMWPIVSYDLRYLQVTHNKGREYSMSSTAPLIITVKQYRCLTVSVALFILQNLKLAWMWNRDWKLLLVLLVFLSLKLVIKYSCMRNRSFSILFPFNTPGEVASLEIFIPHLLLENWNSWTTMTTTASAVCTALCISQQYVSCFRRLAIINGSKVSIWYSWHINRVAGIARPSRTVRWTHQCVASPLYT